MRCVSLRFVGVGHGGQVWVNQVMVCCVWVCRLSLGKVRSGRLSYGVLGRGGFVAARFGEFR